MLGGLAGLILAVPGVRFRSHNLAMVTFVFQAVVIIVLRQSKGLTGGAEGLPIPAPVVFGFRFSSDADFLLLCGFLSALVILPLVVLLTSRNPAVVGQIAADPDLVRFLERIPGLVRVKVLSSGLEIKPLIGNRPPAPTYLWSAFSVLFLVRRESDQERRGGGASHVGHHRKPSIGPFSEGRPPPAGAPGPR